MGTFQLILLSIIQGLTEFLPISSSAHLVLISDFINEEDQGIVFDVGVHFGTMMAALIYFRKEVRAMLSGLISMNFFNKKNVLFFNLIVGVIPILVVGYFFRDSVETSLRNAEVIAYSTIGFGLLLYLAHKFKKKHNNLNSLSLSQAFVIGLFQCLALIPGTSRSGITITAGLFLGLNATSASRFSFLLAIPTIGAISLVELIRLSKMDLSQNGLQLLLAASISFVVAYATINIFLRVIDRIGFTPFVIYRLILGGWLLLFWL